jgi:hypothetical protein
MPDEAVSTALAILLVKRKVLGCTNSLAGLRGVEGELERHKFMHAKGVVRVSRALRV